MRHKLDAPDKSFPQPMLFQIDDLESNELIGENYREESETVW